MNTPPSSNGEPLSKPLILFDGFCHLCDGFVQFILKHDSKEQFLFAPLQSQRAEAFFIDLKIPPSFKNSVVLIEGTRYFTESTAALRVASKLDFPWKFLGFLKIIPRFIRDPSYRFIAKNRYRWFGKKQTCFVSQDRTRFLD